MPVEIKELIIRTNIISDAPEGASARGNRISPKEMSEVIETCVDRVVKIMNRKDER